MSLETIDVNECVDRNKVKQEVFDIFCDRGIKTPEELDIFFKEYLGITIPKKKVCPNHLSPFEIICDIFLNKPPMSLWISSRGSGKTYLLSSLDTAHLVTKPNFNIIHSAAVQDQTNRAYEYFIQSHKDPNIRDALDCDPTRSKTTFKNNSDLSLITMTWAGTNSPHVPLLVVDEIELIRDWSILQEAMCIPQSKNGYRAQTVMMSTRKWSTGIVQRLVDESEKRGIKVYESCIFEVLEKCTRECKTTVKDVETTCPAYNVCQGKAHECEGFYTIDDFIEKVLQLDEETIDAQYCCNKPLGYKGASVYNMYEKVHIVDWSYFKKITGYDRPPLEWKRIAGVDFESVFVYVSAVIEPMTGRKWVYAEHYHDANSQGMLTLDEHVARIQNLENWTPSIKSWADPSAKQEIYELKRRGVPCVKSPKMAIRTGVDLIRSLLKTNEVLGTPMLMFIKDEVPKTISSMQNWSFHRNDDGTIDYDNYSDEDDHGADAIRYCFYGYSCKPSAKGTRMRGLYG